MADTKNIQVNIKGSATSLQQASKKAKSSLGGVEKGANKMGQALAGAFGAAIVVAGIGRAIKKIAEFEKTMRRVALISGGAEKQLTSLARTLGGTTVFTAKEAGDAMAFLAQAGFDANEILEATPGVLELAAAAQLDLARAADIASNVLSAYGLEAEELNRINDILVTTTNNSNTSVEQFAEAFKTVGPIAKGAGVSLNEVASLIGVLGDAGIQGSLAGTQLKVAISTLINPSAAAAKVLDKLNISTKNADGTMRGLTDIFADLRDANLSAEDAFKIFEQRAASGALVMAGAADKARELAIQTEENGVAASQSAAQMDTLSGSIAGMKSAYSELVLEGGRFNGVIRQGIDFLTEFAQFLDAGFSVELAQAKNRILDNADATFKWLESSEELSKFQKRLVVAFANDVAILESYGISLEDLGIATKDVGDEALTGLEKIKAFREQVEQAKLKAIEAAAAAGQFSGRIEALTLNIDKEIESERELNAERALGLALALEWQDVLDPVVADAEERIEVLDREAESLARIRAITQQLIIDKTKQAKAEKEIAIATAIANKALGLNNKTTLEAAVATAALAIANRASAKEIIAAALAVAVAEAIKSSVFAAKNPILGLLLAGVAIAGVKALFSSIPEFARGTSFTPSGAVLVGERGPEVLTPPRGSRITPNHLSAGGGGISIVVNGFVGDEFQLATVVSTALANQGSNVDRTSFV